MAKTMTTKISPKDKEYRPPPLNIPKKKKISASLLLGGCQKLLSGFFSAKGLLSPGQGGLFKPPTMLMWGVKNNM